MKPESQARRVVNYMQTDSVRRGRLRHRLPLQIGVKEAEKAPAAALPASKLEREEFCVAERPFLGRRALRGALQDRFVT